MSKRSVKAEKEYGFDAKNGDPVAQFNLGHAYYLDAEDVNECAEALTWVRKAASQDYDYAMAHLVLRFQHLIPALWPEDRSLPRFNGNEASQAEH